MNQNQNTIPAVKPSPNESMEQFTVRAHKALLPYVSDPDQRNTMVWSAWQHENGSTGAEQRSSQHFADPEKFHKKDNVCYFVEHETHDSHGDPVRFAVGDLAEIVQTMNHRASDRKAFSAISDNHTSPTDGSHAGDPPVLGAAGCYRLGMVGHDDPKFAIFADEYHYAEHAKELAKKPRRSVELVTFHKTNERFLDPIAALGGRAPRLPLPTQYSVDTYSAEGDRYSHGRYEAMGGDGMAGPAMLPGASNTRVKSTDYFTDDNPEPTEGSSMQISDEDIAQLVNAIGNMPEFEWVRSKMEGEMGGAVDPEASGGMDDVGEGGLDDEPLGDEFAPEAAPGADLDQNAALMGEASGGSVVTPPAEDAQYDDQLGEEEQYMAGAAGVGETFYEGGSNDMPNQYSAQGQSQGTVSIEQYNALKTSHVNVIKQLGGISQAMKANEEEKIDAHRKASIDNVCRDYPTMYEPQEEYSRFLYSAGANVSDEQFDAEIVRLQAVGNRTMIQQNTIPRGVVDRGQPQKTERNAAFFEAVTKLQEDNADKGEFMDYNELVSIVEARQTA